MNSALERLVWQRAIATCEYCRMQQAFDASPFQIDHIIAQKHGGQTVDDNLALACLQCNLCKGPNIAGIDPQFQSLTRLFHPRLDRWHENFRWSGPLLVGLTDVGRTTIEVLAINSKPRLAIRTALIAEGVFPVG